MYEVVNTRTGASHGRYPTRSEAMGCVAYDRLRDYSIVWSPSPSPARRRPRRTACECSDPGCPAHRGTAGCTHRAVGTAVRIDMEDRSGTRMCQRCLEDALDSGVFRTR